MSGDELRQLIRRLARERLGENKWALIPDHERFLQEVEAQVEERRALSSRGLEDVIRRAADFRFGYIWHACCRRGGSLAQRRAFEILRDDLDPIAYRSANGNRQVADELLQEALLLIAENIDSVRTPGAFFCWASRILIHVTHDAGEKRKRRKVHEIAIADLVRSEGSREDEPEPPLPDPTQSGGPEAPALGDQERGRLVDVIRSCLSPYKRAAEYFAVIIGHFLEEKTVLELMRELKCKGKDIHRYKFQALKYLGRCVELLEAMKWLIR